jgi:hypothetical protein
MKTFIIVVGDSAAAESESNLGFLPLKNNIIAIGGIQTIHRLSFGALQWSN